MRLSLVATALLVLFPACGDETDYVELEPSASFEEAASASLVVYGDALTNGFADWSWGTHSLASATAHSGTGVSFEPDSWNGLYFHRDTSFDVTQYASLSFWTRGGGQNVAAALYANNAVVARVTVPATPAGAWTQVTLPVSSVSGAKTIDGVAFVDLSGANQATLYVDDVAFLPPVQTQTVFADALASGVSDWSWGTHSLAATTPVHGGARSISFVPANWSALYLSFAGGLDPAKTPSVSFWLYGASRLTFALVRGGKAVTSTPITGTAGAWRQFSVDISTLADGFWLADAAGTTQPTVYIDDIALTTTPSSNLTVQIDRTQNRRAVNPEIYGVNFGEDAANAAMKYPSRRWGGNAVSRYNWQNDMSNTGADWFYMNVPQSDAVPALLPHGSAADVFIDTTRRAGGQPLITIPALGWVPADQTKRWSYSVNKYGAQQQTECAAAGGASWCTGDAGNGVRSNGTKIGANPADTSKAVGTSFASQWIAHIQSRVGNAANGGVRYYAIDNEPSLWNETHRDVHPNGLTYDELWQKTRDYGRAIKAADPNAKTFGPAEWGWCGYLDSSGGCGASADRKAHGDLPMLAYYLKQVCAEKASSGVRVVDYLDVHYYPQTAGVSLSSDESAATQAARLRSVKSLYDPSYVDESWIATPIQLIPRMQSWINTYCPGTKLAITEYHFGNDTGLTAALAQAEVLAIFGREGVDFATRWIAPNAGTLVEDAFKLFLNYDGAGSRVTGTSVRAASSNFDSVASYAVEGADGKLRVVLVNHDTVSRTVTLNAANARGAALYGFDASKRLGALGSVTAASTGVVTLTLSARSATLAVLN